MFIITYRKVFYIISVILVGLSIAAVSVWGLKPGIDFAGGSILEVSYNTRPEKVAVVEALTKLSLGDASVREAGDTGYLIRMKDMTPAEKDAVTKAITKLGEGFSEKRFDSVGPILGKEAIQKSFISIIGVLLAIIIFIAFAFRKVSRPVSSWKYGLIAVVALLHDVFIPVGVFSVLGHFMGVEVDTLFVTALLVILGFSVHDTIVVFDRVRENLRRDGDQGGRTPFDQIVGKSVSETFVRSINTSLTTLLAVLVLYFVGPASTKFFALALLIGITVGTYSSIFIGSPLLVTWQKLAGKNK